MARTTVADVLVDGLVRAGAARLFVAPGGAMALPAAASRRSLAVVEAPDAMAAAVLAAVSGEVGDGPGAAVARLDDPSRLVRGLAHAQRERSPAILVTEAGVDAGLLAPVVKASLIVEAASAGHWIAHAAQLAMADPRGPVHLAVAAGVVEASTLPVASSCRPAPLPPPTSASLEAFGAALAAATRPVLVAGLECAADDVRWIRSFAEVLPAPVVSTPKGKGALADPHPLAVGALTADHPALARADLVILLGVDEGELPPGVLPAGTRLARIGRAPWPHGVFVAEALGDLSLVIEELAPHVRARPAADWDVAELDRMKRSLVQAVTSSPEARLVAMAREATPAGTLATGDVPALAAWQAVAPRETLSPLGPTPGYAILAGLAAQLAHTDRRVLVFTNPTGLTAGGATLRQAWMLGLPLIVVVFGEVQADSVATLEDAGVELRSCRGEGAFGLELSRAFLAGQPAVIAVRSER